MILFWIGFLALIGLLLALDLGVFHKHDSEPNAKDALRWTFIWVTVGLAFAGFVYGAYSNHWFGIGMDSALYKGPGGGANAAMDYVTGYLVEYSLSLDNIFVMSMIFAFFKIPGKYQHRVLFWGILGAIVMRAIMILAGTALVSKFDWVMYLFGAFLVFTAAKMLLKKEDDEVDPEKSAIVRWVRKLYPVSADLDGHKFFTRLPDGRKAVTRLFLALLVVENTDVVFAVDSIPAIFAVTKDPFLVFSSNIFAIMGLRSLYFALSAMLNAFHLLKYSIIFILAFVGVKMLIIAWWHPASWVSLAVIVVALTAGVMASKLFPAKESA